jgi:hypothetical protein
MSHKALETGKCSLDDLTEYGRKRFLSLFLADIVIFVPLAIAAGILFVVQMIFPGEFVTILSLAAGIALSIVPYSIVLGDMGPFKGIKAGYGIFKENKFQTTLLYTFTYYFMLFSVYWVILACMVICSLALFFIPMPQGSTIPEIVSAVAPSLWIIAVAILLAAVFYVLVETMVLSPMITLFWAAYHASKTKQMMPPKMAESIEETLKNGFMSWRNNLEIGVPYLLSMIITAALAIVMVFGVTFITVAASTLTRDMNSQAAPFVVLAALLASLLAGLAIIAALNAYFSAGAIGMSLEAAVKSRTTLADMASYGRKGWLDIFKMNILWIALLAIPGAILFVPPVYAFYAGAIPQGTALTFIATTVYLTYAAVLCFLYTVTGTAIIVDGAGVMQGIRSAYNFSSRNKTKVLLLFFTYTGTLTAASLAWGVLTSPLGLLQFLSPAVYGISEGLMMLVFLLIAAFMITPLYTIWLTRTYLGRGAKGAKTMHSPVPRRPTRDTTRHIRLISFTSTSFSLACAEGILEKVISASIASASARLIGLISAYSLRAERPATFPMNRILSPMSIDSSTDISRHASAWAMTGASMLSARP